LEDVTFIMTAVRIAALLSVAGLNPALAQTPPMPAPPATIRVYEEMPGAQETREQLQRLLRQFPPAVGEVLQRDPSLMNRPDYLAPYPALVAFLQQHPEVARNPSFFLGTFHYRDRDPRERAYESLNMLIGTLAGVTAGLMVASVFVWLIRAVIDHRRWLRLSSVQTDVHTKLIDRLTSNEDLLAYIQSPAGRRFLESAPIPLDGEARPAGAPLGRILLSLQAGIVLVALGIGLWFARSNVLEELSQGFYVMGVIAMALGVGFAMSAAASFVISTRLGLMPPPRPETRA
jgi:hypothetical protein